MVRDAPVQEHFVEALNKPISLRKHDPNAAGWQTSEPESRLLRPSPRGTLCGVAAGDGEERDRANLAIATGPALRRELRPRLCHWIAARRMPELDCLGLILRPNLRLPWASRVTLGQRTTICFPNVEVMNQRRPASFRDIGICKIIGHGFEICTRI